MAGMPRNAPQRSRHIRLPGHLSPATLFTPTLAGMLALLCLLAIAAPRTAVAQARPVDARTTEPADTARVRDLLSRRTTVPVDQSRALQRLREQKRDPVGAATGSVPGMPTSTTAGISTDHATMDKAVSVSSPQTGSIDLSSMDPTPTPSPAPAPASGDRVSASFPDRARPTLDMHDVVIAGSPTPASGGDSSADDTGAAPAEDTAPLRAGELQRIVLQPGDEAVLNRALLAGTRRYAALDPAWRSPFLLTTFPDVFSQLDSQSRKVDLKPYILGGWLVYQPASRKFVGKLHVGVTDLVDRTPGRDLSVPLLFEVMDEDVAVPARQQIDRTSPPTLPFTIAVAQPDEPFTVHVASSFDPEGVHVPMKIKPTLVIETDRRILQGFGVETVGVNVWTYGRDKPENITITLSSDPSVHFEQTSLKLDAEGRASTRLRSDWPGTVVLRASGRGFDSVPVEITVQWPWQTLLFSLCGGLLGALLRHLPQKRRGAGRQWWVAVAVSIGAGLLVFLLMLLGVDLLPLTLKVQVGYAFVFVASALGAWFGVKLLER